MAAVRLEVTTTAVTPSDRDSPLLGGEPQEMSKLEIGGIAATEVVDRTTDEWETRRTPGGGAAKKYPKSSRRRRRRLKASKLGIRPLSRSLGISRHAWRSFLREP